MISIALASLRRRPVSMLVLTVLGLIAALMLTFSGTVLATAVVLAAPPDRFSAPVVVAGPAGFSLPDQEHQRVPYPEGSVVPADVHADVRAELRDAARASGGGAEVEEYREPGTGRLTGLGVAVQGGLGTDVVAERLQEALGDRAQVLVGDHRGRAEEPRVTVARVPLIVAGAVSGGLLFLVIGLVVWSSLSLVIGARRAELRLLRLVGATPRQARRLVVLEATAAAAVGAAMGALAGPWFATALLDRLGRAGVLPSLLETAGQQFAAGVAFVMTVVVVWVTAGIVAGPNVRRVDDVDPEPAADLSPLPPVRRSLATVVGAGAGAMLVATPFLGPEAGSSIGGPAMLVAVVAVAILGPGLVRRSLAIWDQRRSATGIRGLVVLDLDARAARVAPLLALLALGVTLALGNAYAATTTAAAEAPDLFDASAAVTAEDGARITPYDLERVVAAAAGRTATVSPVRVSTGWIEEPYDRTGSDPLPLLGLDHADVLAEPEAVAGSLSDLSGATIAITAGDAERLDLGVGDALVYRFGDGAREELMVAAVLEGGRGTQARIVPQRLLANHVRAAAPVVVVSDVATDEYGQFAARLADHLASFGTAVEVTRDPNEVVTATAASLGGLIYLAVAALSLLFTGIVAFHNIAALTLSRRDELATWRLVGATRGQRYALLLTPVIHVTAVSLVLGAAIALCAVAAIGAGLGTLPTGPPAILFAVVLATMAVTTSAAAIAGVRATAAAHDTKPAPGGA